MAQDSIEENEAKTELNHLNRKQQTNFMLPHLGPCTGRGGRTVEGIHEMITRQRQKNNDP